jgi:hypothetical protein
MYPRKSVIVSRPIARSLSTHDPLLGNDLATSGDVVPRALKLRHRSFGFCWRNHPN